MRPMLSVKNRPFASVSGKSSDKSGIDFNAQEQSRKTLLAKVDDFIVRNDHPCVMAQTLWKQKNVHTGTYGKLGVDDPTQLYNDLKQWLETGFDGRQQWRSFMALFPADSFDTESAFEAQLWQQLQNLHDIDDQYWDPTTSADPSNKDFSYSLLGNSFYVVGMHPQSSRMARRSPVPTLVFNLHAQFEQLRDLGLYSKVKKTIRKRDQALQGDINPMLRDFGQASEASQYSGRQVDSNSWKCPFHAKANSGDKPEAHL